jgi:photosystem II stability/assembly factor-like uncharacterized protein
MSPDGDIGDVDFLNHHFGWAAVSWSCQDQACVVVYQTSDGGLTWQPRTDPPLIVQDRWIFPIVRLATEDVGWLVDGGGGLFVTTDGARTWRHERTDGFVVALEPYGESVWRLERSCSGSEQDSPCPYTLLVSNDQGRIWERSPAEPPIGQAGASFVRPSAEVAYILSDQGSYPPEEWRPDPLLARTTDTGHSWTTMTPPCPAHGVGGSRGWDLAVSIPDDLWLVCHDEPGSGAMQSKHLFRSSDGGQSWSADLGTPNSGAGGQTAAASPARACRGGSRTGIACTRDGGRSWFFPIPGGAENPRDGGVKVVQFSDDHHGWAIGQDAQSGNFNQLWRTTDGGESWSSVTVASDRD